MSLGEVFDPRRNALNVWRLLLAAEVILWHSFLGTGRAPMIPHAAMQLTWSVGVDGFFAISGFLITRSWVHRPKARDYLAARALRILPGLWACLIVTAFIIAPIGVAVQGGSPKSLLLSTGPISYVFSNFFVLYVQQGINGTPAGVPAPNTWNGSLWSLFFELLCYLTVMVLGLIGVMRYRWLSVVLLIGATALALLFGPLAPPGVGVWSFPQIVARAAIMFAAGAVLFQWREAIPANWWLVALCVAIVIGAGVLLPDYRIVASLPLAYAVVVSGVLLSGPILRNDFSYGMYIYAFPVQQVLVMAGLMSLPPLLFFGVATIATFPLAAASWFLIERRAMRLKHRIRGEAAPPDTGGHEIGRPASSTGRCG